MVNISFQKRLSSNVTLTKNYDLFTALHAFKMLMSLCIPTPVSLYFIQCDVHFSLRWILQNATTIVVVTWEHDDVIKWKHFPRYWPFVRGIHRSPVNSTHKGQWRGALMFSLICTCMDGWVINREAGDLRRHRAHYAVTVMNCRFFGYIYVFIYYIFLYLLYF